MSRSVFLFRHGKSDWDAAYPTDHERPVAPRGRKAARLMGRFVRDTGQAPDLVIASSALRARSTAELAIEAGGWASGLEVEPRLYGASASTILELAQALPEDLASVLFAGHEPTCSTAVGLLTGRVNLRFPTAAMARIDFAGDSWERVRAGRGTLVWLVPPRLLRSTRWRSCC